MEKLLVVDGNSLVNRAFYALPLLTNKDGEYSNAVYGFVNILTKFIIEQKPDYIAVAFDHSRHTFRNDLYSDYKGTRKAMSDELRSQMPILKSMLEKMHIKTFEIDGIEADDIIGTIAKSTKADTIILSGDRDVLQLIDDTTEVWLTKKGITDVIQVDIKNMVELFGYEPYQVIEMKSIMGDSADNIPGVNGIGQVGALNLIQKYKTLDNVYENIDEITGKTKEKLIDGKDMAYLSHTLATIKTDCDISFSLDECVYDFPFNENVKNEFIKYDFKSLLKRSELFENSVKLEKPSEPKIRKEIIKISSLAEIKKALEQNIEFLAFNFVSDISFAINNKSVYIIESQESLFNLEILKLDDIVESLKPVLNDSKILKITYDLKSHMHKNEVFANLKGEIFDLSIAQYLLHAGEKVGEKLNVADYFDLKKEFSLQLNLLGLDFIYNEIEMPLSYVLFDMEKNGFNIDKTELDFLSEKYKTELTDLTNQIYKINDGESFNINSPKQLAEILFNKLNLSDKGNKKHSTGIDVLTELYYSHEIIPLIVRYRKLQKLNSTYIEVYEELVKKYGNCIHTIFNQTMTATGRLSSSEPNLQNIPIREDEGKGLRKIFISRFSNGQIVSADYSQIELRLLASFSGDENLVDAYVHNKDIHRATASQIFNISESEITDNERRMAKAVNFGIVYGISAYGLANQIGVKPYQAKEFMERYKNTYKNVDIYMNKNIEYAKENGYVKTMYGRIRKINELFSQNKIIQSFGERVAMNMPLQGSASDIIKLAMIKVDKRLRKENLQSKLILQIHDELIIDAKEDEIEKVKQILKDCMENVANLKVPLIVNIESGKTWFDSK